ncbi:MAG TPA: hypothetical protein ENI66_02395 [Candidatus Yonathbacteria bacterium]|nr:hypothetical protein [Candidatus Yonathbacteria bacterium]
MGSADKFLSKLSAKKKAAFVELVARISRDDILGLDSKKLKGEYQLYRIRKGAIRIIFSKENTGNIILSIEKRSDKTYKNL